MAENTRMKYLYETLRTHDQNFINNGKRMSKMEEELNELHQTLSSVNQNIEYLLRKPNEDGSGSNGGNEDRAEGSENARARQETYTPPHLRNQNNQQNSISIAYKVDFPEFKGENPQNWIRKANRFFELKPNENRKKVLHAGYYMVDVADIWYMEYVEGKTGIDWETFCEMMLHRFLSPGGEDVVHELDVSGSRHGQYNIVSKEVVSEKMLTEDAILEGKDASENQAMKSSVIGGTDGAVVVIDECSLARKFSRMHVSGDSVFTKGCDQSRSGSMRMEFEKLGASNRYWDDYSNHRGSGTRRVLNPEREFLHSSAETQHSIRPEKWFPHYDIGNSALNSQFFPRDLLVDDNLPVGLSVWDDMPVSRRPFFGNALSYQLRHAMNLLEAKNAYYSHDIVLMMPLHYENDLLKYQALVLIKRSNVPLSVRMLQEEVNTEDSLIFQGKNINNGFQQNRGVDHSVARPSLSHDRKISSLIEMQYNHRAGSSMGSQYSPRMVDRFEYGNSGLNPQFQRSSLLADNGFGIGSASDASSYLNRRLLAESLFYGSHNGYLSEGNGSFSLPNMVVPRYNDESALNFQSPLPNARSTLYTRDRTPQGRDGNYFDEDSLIIHGGDTNYGMKRQSCPSRENNENGAKTTQPLPLPLKFGSLAEVMGYTYQIAKDQHCCRFLQRIFEEGTARDVQMTFNEIIGHMDELMMKPFGNYLMQMLLEVCNEELTTSGAQRIDLSDVYKCIVEFSIDQHGSWFIQQKLENCSAEEKNVVFNEVLPHASKLIIDIFGNYVIQKFFEHGTYQQLKELVSQLSGHMLPLNLQMYGCRVIQKALEAIELSRKTELVHELDGHMMRCVRDQNGNHVAQKYIECFPAENIDFIISETTLNAEVDNYKINIVGVRLVKFSAKGCEPENISLTGSEIVFVS